MKLEVGMYVRTTDGLLALLTELYNENSVIVKWQYDEKRRRESFSQSISKDYIKKASHNIIDLIEEGDYVNGYRVCATDIEIGTPIEDKSEYRIYCACDETFAEEDIKSIVTKEQFKNTEYEVKE